MILSPLESTHRNVFWVDEKATRGTGLTLTVKSWTEVADDAAAMLGRTAGGGGGELAGSGRSGCDS
jgi:hypothetical protein